MRENTLRYFCFWFEIRIASAQHNFTSCDHEPNLVEPNLKPETNIFTKLFEIWATLLLWDIDGRQSFRSIGSCQKRSMKIDFILLIINYLTFHSLNPNLEIRICNIFSITCRCISVCIPYARNDRPRFQLFFHLVKCQVFFDI